MIKKDTVKVVITVADVASILILAYLILKAYLDYQACFKMFDSFLTIIPLIIIKIGEMLLIKYK